MCSMVVLTPVSLPSWVRLGTILKSRQGYDLAYLLGKEHRLGPKVSMACHLETQIKQNYAPNSLAR